jgi:Cdc6-like AAA superfamily ATPase
VSMSGALERKDPNAHIVDFLEYYSRFPHAPGYAVLVNGHWGSGKTFLVRRILGELFTDHHSYAYVSLFGLTNLDEIDAALLQAAFPVLSWKSTKIAGKLAKAALKFFNADPELKPADVFNQSSFEFVVFDDLERVEMPINEVMGYINGLVEQEGKKCVVIANEKEIEFSESYKKRREKLIGKTLEIEADLPSALEYFLSKISDAGAGDVAQQSRI